MPYYVTLTGSKNNAGDFLIKYRAYELLGKLRPDREIVDLNGWEPINSEKLEIINRAKALILLGGPALQRNMVPYVYNLPENLADIKVPIIMMGVGWYSHSGEWSDSHSYALSNRSLELLGRINASGSLSSVRDYHTLNVLASKGFDNFRMTGCPALYDLDMVASERPTIRKPKRAGFSLGVALKESSSMFRQMQDAVIATKEAVGDECEYDVVFHHGLGDEYLKSHGGNTALHKAQARFAGWLESQNISYVDISGSAENLINYYSGCDFHVGYRVHAHIFMSSIGKPSILLNEDGRGKGLQRVLGGVLFDSYTRCIKNKLVSGLLKLKVPYDNYQACLGLANDLKFAIPYELECGVRLSHPFASIDSHFNVMKGFIAQLP